jgi:leucyl/phenylalanyl-tRNA---protein transferase
VIHPTPTPAPLGSCAFRFPDPRRAPPDGLLASGADLAPATVIAAYRAGIFPWPCEGYDLLWWSPDPRAVIPPDALHVSRRLARTLRSGRHRLTLNAAFADVIAACAARSETWITAAIREAYIRLHTLGWAHSVEVWEAGALVGGLYGVAVGGLFAAESMFHRARDASRIALVGLAAHCRRAGITLIDVQLPTPHLAAMGAVTVPRHRYLALLADAVERRVEFARSHGSEQTSAARRPPLTGGPRVQ